MDHTQHAIQQHMHMQQRMHDEQHQRMNHDLLRQTMRHAGGSNPTGDDVSPGEAMFLTVGGAGGAAAGTGMGAGISAVMQNRAAERQRAEGIGNIFRHVDDAIKGGPIPSNFAEEFANISQNIERARSANASPRISPKAMVGGGVAGLALGTGVGYAPIAIRQMAERRRALENQHENMNKTASTFF